MKSPPAFDIVLEVRVEGNRRLSTAAVLSHVKTRVGEPLDESVVKADEQRLLETRQFTSVLVTKAATDRGIIVTFIVTERPVIEAIRIVGNEKVKTAELTKELTFTVGDPLDRFWIESGRKAIEKHYREKSYTQVQVTVDSGALEKREVVYTVHEGPRTLIHKIRFEGNTHFDWLKLRMTIGSAERFWPFVTGVLDSEQVQRDVDTLRNLYLDEGFLDAEVSHRLEVSADRTRAVLTFVIHQGPRYRVGKIILKGNTVFADADLIARLSLGSGEYFTAQGLQRDAKTLQDAYGEVGYVDATIRAGKQFPTPAGQETVGPPALVNLVYQITEGEQYRVGRIIIRGNAVTQDRVIRRDVRLFPEQLYNTVAAEESRKRLMESRLFDRVTITPEGSAPLVRDAAVTVEEGRTGQIMLGVGVSTNSGLIGNITYTQRNFDILAWPSQEHKFPTAAWRGAGQTLTISAEPGTELNQAYIDWFEPRLCDKEYSLGQRVFYYERERESYDERRVGYVPSFGHRFPNRWYGELSARIETVRIADLESDAPPEVRRVEGDSFLAGPKLTLTRDRTDSRWMPSTGDRLQLSYEEIVGDQNFRETMIDYRFYRTLGMDALDRKHILATRLTAGYLCADPPVFEKFYGGGIGSIRGFEYRGVSPRSRGTDEPIGGNFLLLAGTEYTFPLVGEMLRGVVFLDTGTVEKEFKITRYRTAAGFGVRWVIPMLGQVPMSFDFGFPITKDDEDDTQIFSFSIGLTF